MKTKKIYAKWEKDFYDSMFYLQLIKEIDSNKTISISGTRDDGESYNNNIPPAMYNLFISIRDLGLWKSGLKPHRYWKVSDVKKFYNLKGNAEKIYKDLVRIKDMLQNKQDQVNGSDL